MATVAAAMVVSVMQMHPLPSHMCASASVSVCVCVCGGQSCVTDRIMTLQRNCVIVNFALIIIVNTLFIFFFFIHKLNPSRNYEII